MQIFLSDEQPEKCARNLDDVRLRKMPIEAAQIASTALWINNCDLAETMYSKGLIYLPTHENHPLVKWCAESVHNYKEVIRHGVCLCYEYKYRFFKIHSTEGILWNLSDIPGYPSDSNCSTPPNATTHHKHIDDIYLAYQQELCYKWNVLDKKEPTWTRREEPSFRYY